MRIVVNIFFVLWLGVTTLRAQEEVGLVKLDALEERLAQGGDTIYVVNFWATWCAPCVAELPHFEKLQQVHVEKPLKVLLVSLDAVKRKDIVDAFVARNNLKNEIVILDEKNEQEYIDKISNSWSGAIPATLFVSTSADIRLFKEQEFEYEELEKTYLSIVNH